MQARRVGAPGRFANKSLIGAISVAISLLRSGIILRATFYIYDRDDYLHCPVIFTAASHARNIYRRGLRRNYGN